MKNRVRLYNKSGDVEKIVYIDYDPRFRCSLSDKERSLSCGIGRLFKGGRKYNLQITLSEYENKLLEALANVTSMSKPQICREALLFYARLLGCGPNF